MKSNNFAKVFVDTSIACQGKGVFAVQHLKKKEGILQVEGEFLSYEQACVKDPDICLHFDRYLS